LIRGYYLFSHAAANGAKGATPAERVNRNERPLRVDCVEKVAEYH